MQSKKKKLLIPKTDVVFQALFGTKGNERILEGLLTEILENKVENVIVNKRLNQKPENVKIEVDKSTIPPESVTIIITDNNEDHYMYWEDFGLQKKVNGKWEYVDYIIEGFSWIDGYYGSYDLDENNQLIQKLDIEKYHGKLSKGTYRIVKIVTDANYMANINIYSDEFEIK